MSIETNKTVVRRYYDEVLNLARISVLDELATDDYVENDPFPGQGNGRPDLKARVSTLLSAFSPCRFTIEDIVAEGDMSSCAGGAAATTRAPSSGCRRRTATTPSRASTSTDSRAVAWPNIGTS